MKGDPPHPHHSDHRRSGKRENHSELEPSQGEETALVFIGRDLKSQQTEILGQLRNCEL
jgi:hypothetical protein